jgi:hypothetical protein
MISCCVDVAISTTENPTVEGTKTGMNKVTTMLAVAMLALGLLSGCATARGGHDHAKCSACCKDNCASCCKDAAACAKCCGTK